MKPYKKYRHTMTYMYGDDIENREFIPQGAVEMSCSCGFKDEVTWRSQFFDGWDVHFTKHREWAEERGLYGEVVDN